MPLITIDSPAGAGAGAGAHPLEFQGEQIFAEYTAAPGNQLFFATTGVAPDYFVQKDMLWITAGGTFAGNANTKSLHWNFYSTLNGSYIGAEGWFPALATAVRWDATLHVCRWSAAALMVHHRSQAYDSGGNLVLTKVNFRSNIYVPLEEGLQVKLEVDAPANYDVSLYYATAHWFKGT